MEQFLCPLDGRYAKNVQSLKDWMGEKAFAQNRVQVECAWLETLASGAISTCPSLSDSQKEKLKSLFFLSDQEFSILSDIEFKGYGQIPATKHDVKAVEYFLKLKFKELGLEEFSEWLHFALTSEDVNSIAYALLISNGLEKSILPALQNLQSILCSLATQESSSIMLARTHGQPAVPTTFGKEIRVFAERLKRQIDLISKSVVSCKFGGAIGNYNAHLASFPQVNWRELVGEFIAKLNQNRNVKLILSEVSTQVDNRDTYAEVFDNLRRINIILLDLCQDMWAYISRALVKQRVVAGEVGSSTMPQKVNPIDFENAEGNLQLANALLEFFSRKLPVSRLQRDLSDSTVLRNISVAFGYALVAYSSIIRGIGKVSFNKELAKEELNAHPEVLAEAIQTILRAEGVANPYEKLRDFSRGKVLSLEEIRNFINNLDVDNKVKEKLNLLTPENYIGCAEKLAEGNYD